MMAKRIGLGETATSRRSAADTGSGRTAPEAAWRQTAISRHGVARARLPEQSAAIRPPCQSLARTPRARPRDQRRCRGHVPTHGRDNCRMRLKELIAVSSLCQVAYFFRLNARALGQTTSASTSTLQKIAVMRGALTPLCPVKRGFTPRSLRGVAAGAEPEVRIHLPPAASRTNFPHPPCGTGDRHGETPLGRA
jgi:hypothetical protein